VLFEIRTVARGFALDVDLLARPHSTSVSRQLYTVAREMFGMRFLARRKTSVAVGCRDRPAARHRLHGAVE